MSETVIDFNALLTPEKSVILLSNVPDPLLPPKWRELWSRAVDRYAADGAANILYAEAQAGKELPLPRILSGDFDSATDEAKAFFADRGVPLVTTEDQDFSDLTKLMRIVLQGEYEQRKIKVTPHDAYQSLMVLGALGGRFDHTLHSLSLFLDARRFTSKPLVLVDRYNVVFLVFQGTTRITFSGNRVPDYLTGYCGIMPFVQRPTRVTTRGYRWCVTDALFDYDGGITSACNRLEDPSGVTVTTNEPVIVTFEIDWSKFV